MANANLQVKVGADVSGFLAQMRQMDANFNKATRSVNDHGFALGKTQRALESFAVSSLGANHTLGMLTTVLGDFAVGSVAVTGVLLGIGAIAGAYELITAGARKATEEQNKLTKALAEQFRPKTGKGSATLEKYDGAVKQRADAMRHLGYLQGSSTDFGVAASYLSHGEAAPMRGRADEIDAVTASLREANQAIALAQAGSVTAMTTVTSTARNMDEVAAKAVRAFVDQIHASMSIFDELKTQGVSSNTVNASLITSYDAVAAKLRDMGDVASVARSEMLALQAAMMGNIVVAQHVAAINSAGTVGPLAGKTLPGVTLAANSATKDAVNKLTNGPMSHVGGPPSVVKDPDQLAADAAHTALLTNAIQNSAATIASVVGNAIIRVGSGKGSQIGAAIGGAAAAGVGGLLGAKAGEAIGGLTGAAVGSVIPVVGTIIGSFLGSAIGGLFDHHKKAVDKNTSAIQALTAAMLLHAPAGFKVEEYRFDATRGVLGRRPPVGASGASGGGVVIYGDVHIDGVQDLKDLGRQARAAASRGGASPLVMRAA